MNSRGLSLVELVVVIAIMGILSSIAMFSFNDYSQKSEIETQMHKLYSDMMALRSKGLYEKRTVSMKVTTTGYSFYSSASQVVPYQTVVLKKPVTWTSRGSATSASIVYDYQGMLQTVDNLSICASASNKATVDSVILSITMVKLGKLNDGTDCAHGNIVAKQ